MKELYDLIIIGGGPAGLTAAIYAGRAKLKTLVVERAEFGGQIRITSEVVNYPGIRVTSGPVITDEMKRQAADFGADFITTEALSFDFSKDIKEVKTGINESYKALAVIIATGAKPCKLGFEGEAEFSGRGVAYCATCDGEFFAGKDVFVIGAGFAAAEEAIFLTRYARKVIVIAREPEFTCSKTISDKVLSHSKIDVHFNTEIVYAKGTHVLKEAKFINNKTKETWEHHVESKDNTFGIFVFVGYEPLSEHFKGHIKLDGRGYIPTDEEMQTDVSGVYAAGDIRPKRLKQIITATSDGAIAATAAEKYIEAKKEELNIKTEGAAAANYLNEDSIKQIRHVMNRIENNVNICAILKDNCELSTSIRNFLNEFAAITDKINITYYKKGENPTLESQIDLFPAIALMDKDGNFSRASFQTVPMGHELESFILAIYNASGPGQPLEDAVKARIQDLSPLNVKVAVSLSCTMCPDVAQAAHRIAILNTGIKAEVIDLRHFPEIRDKFNLMSVPAMVINDKEIVFGKKNLGEIVAILESVK